MKRVLYFLVFLLVAATFNSCEDESFDESLLYGKWVSGTMYYVYSSNKTGYTWDDKDDITEEEAKVQFPFRWELVKSDLQQFHLWIGPDISKTYVVTELTATTLKYKDKDGFRSYSFTRVK